ncbi:MAG: hypothetical protein HOV79_08875 [Hamadaea sp.]|nr:hypothetical protein [Hamadaea sp.]
MGDRLPSPIPDQIAQADETLRQETEPAGGYPTGQDATGKNVLGTPPDEATSAAQERSDGDGAATQVGDAGNPADPAGS